MKSVEAAFDWLTDDPFRIFFGFLAVTLVIVVFALAVDDGPPSPNELCAYHNGVAQVDTGWGTDMAVCRDGFSGVIR